MLKKYAELWDGIKYQIKTINNGKESDYSVVVCFFFSKAIHTQWHFQNKITFVQIEKIDV